MASDIEFVRQFRYDGKVFASKREATEYKAVQDLSNLAGPEDMIARADEVIALLKPFATPRTRKSKATGNGTQAKASAKNQATAGV